MGGCCSKDDGSGKDKFFGNGAFQEIGAGVSADYDWGKKDVPQAIDSTSRTRNESTNSSNRKEQLVVLHAKAREKSRRRSSRDSPTISEEGDSADGALERRESGLGYYDDDDDDLLSPTLPPRPPPASSIVLSPVVGPHVARRSRIQATRIDVSPDFCAPCHQKTDDQARFIAGALEGNFIFSDLGDASTKTLIDAFEKRHIAGDEEVIRQGEVGDYFYIIEKGAVNFFVDGENVGSAQSGDSFGELALLYCCPRAATCRTSGECELWRIDQKTFRSILASDSINNDKETRELLRNVPFFKQLDTESMMRISEALSTLSYEAGETIISKGEEGNVFYVVKSGQVKVTDIEVGDSKFDDTVFGPGGFFGERALVTEEKRVANVKALDKVTLFCLSKVDFNNVLGDFNEVLHRCSDKALLMSMPLFRRSGVTEHEATTLAGMLKDVDFPVGHVFFTEGQVVDKSDRSIYIVRSGSATISTKSGQIHNLTSGGYFGDVNFGTTENEGDDTVVSTTTVTVTEACKVGVLSMSDLEAVLGNLSRLLKIKEGESRPTKLDTSIKMEELKKHKILGVGSFGKVWLMSREVETGTETFALKIQSKRELIGHKLADAAVREKNIMASINSPFIIRLFNAYQDEKHLYMLMQVVQGGELFDVVHTNYRNGIREEYAKFYAAGILEGLAYMHKCQIVYRDLKPENVLIDRKGYTVIVDLGFAKVVQDKTFTLCGTPLYLAPEVILSRGHDKGADFWSWGILIFEMIVGLTPFYEDNIEQLALLKKIVQGKYVFPSGKMSESSRDIVRKLLSRNPIHRLGCLAGAEKDVKDHEWFGDFDFDQLVKQEMKAPWVPQVKSALDSSNFDDHTHLEYARPAREIPLSEEEQQMFKDF